MENGSKISFFLFVWCELFALNNLRVLLKIYVLFCGGGVNFHTCGQRAIRRIFRQPRGHDSPIGGARECNFPRAAKTTNCKHVVLVCVFLRVIFAPNRFRRSILRWSRSDSPRYPDCGKWGGIHRFSPLQVGARGHTRKPFVLFGWRINFKTFAHTLKLPGRNRFSHCFVSSPRALALFFFLFGGDFSLLFSNCCVLEFPTHFCCTIFLQIFDRGISFPDRLSRIPLKNPQKSLTFPPPKKIFHFFPRLFRVFPP